MVYLNNKMSKPLYKSVKNPVHCLRIPRRQKGGTWGVTEVGASEQRGGKRLAGLAILSGAGGADPREPDSSSAVCNFKGPWSKRGATIYNSKIH